MNINVCTLNLSTLQCLKRVYNDHFEEVVKPSFKFSLLFIVFFMNNFDLDYCIHFYERRKISDASLY